MIWIEHKEFASIEDFTVEHIMNLVRVSPNFDLYNRLADKSNNSYTIINLILNENDDRSKFVKELDKNHHDEYIQVVKEADKRLRKELKIED